MSFAVATLLRQELRNSVAQVCSTGNSIRIRYWSDKMRAGKGCVSKRSITPHNMLTCPLSTRTSLPGRPPFFKSTGPTQPDLKYTDDLFTYTRGRFITDEAYEMSQRRVRFDVNALTRRAAEVVGARSCVRIEKYPDGEYNKSMLLTMDDDSQVVAKVPNPNAGLPHLTTASEVATVDFVRILSKEITTRKYSS